MTLAATSISRKDQPIKAILLAGLGAGVLDILAAFISAYIVNGVSPERVLRAVASGVFGKEAFSGGDSMAVWGLLFHLIIATIWAAFFYILYPLLRINSKNVVFAGLVYGIFVWLIMTQVVVKLSNTAPNPFKLAGALRGMIIIMVCVGLPIALIVHKFRKK